jgi:DNA-binding beta-propeller fold protein YncE
MQLRSLVAVFALIMANGPASKAIDIIYVSNGQSLDIKKYDTDGNYLGKFTNTQFSSLAGIAINSTGILYATSPNSNTVSKFDSTGAYLELKFSVFARF